MNTRLANLNDTNGAAPLLYDIAQRVLDDFKGHVYGAEMGIAYGGGVEGIGTLWGTRGDIWGFDTFVGHPTHLGVNPEAQETTCMDAWYVHSDTQNYGREKLPIEYQQGVLDELGLSNVHLVKGEVHKDSCKDIPELHYAMLDMDMIYSMKQGYEAVKDKLVKGAYMCLHDVLPEGHLEGHLYNWWYNEVMPKGEYIVYLEVPGSHLGVYKKK